MKPLKILIFDTNYVKGLSRMIPLLKMENWQKNNCEITVFCTQEGKKFYEHQMKNISFITVNYTYKIKSTYSLPWEYIKITLKTLTKLSSISGKYDVVYSQSGIIDFLFIPWVLKRLDRKIKWFVMVDNLVPSPNKRPGPFLKKFIPYLAFLIGNLLLKNADGIFVVTNFLKDYYQSRGYRVIKTGDGYGIDTAIFKGSIAPSAPRFDALYTGRLHAAKGVFDLIEVVKRVVEKNKDFTLGIMGDGEEVVKRELHKKIDSERLQKNVIFTGYVTGKQKGDILRNAGFFLFLSYDEGCPHAVIEAFANNKLVVAYDLPIYHSVFKQYIEKGQMVLFKEQNYKEIADYINKQDYKKVKFDNSLEDYTWNTIVKNELEAMRK